MKYRAQRYPTRYPVTIRVGAVGFRATATSVSASGVCIAMDDAVPAIGEAVMVESPAGKFKGEIRWVNDDKVGVKFSQAIHKSVLERIRYGLQVSHQMRRPKIGFAELR